MMWVLVLFLSVGSNLIITVPNIKDKATCEQVAQAIQRDHGSHGRYSCYPVKKAN